jgi:hypothetical protein
MTSLVGRRLGLENAAQIEALLVREDVGRDGRDEEVLVRLRTAKRAVSREITGSVEVQGVMSDLDGLGMC